VSPGLRATDLFSALRNLRCDVALTAPSSEGPSTLCSIMPAARVHRDVRPAAILPATRFHVTPLSGPGSAARAVRPEAESSAGCAGRPQGGRKPSGHSRSTCEAAGGRTVIVLVTVLADHERGHDHGSRYPADLDEVGHRAEFRVAGDDRSVQYHGRCRGKGIG